MYTINPNMPKIRMDAVRLVKYRGWSTRQAAKYTGYGQSTIVKWCKKDSTGGWRRIPTRSSRPHAHPKQLPEKLVKEIVDTRLRLKRSAEVIQADLAIRNIKVSLSSVKRTLDRENLLKKRSPWKRYHPPMMRPEAAQPGALIQIDTIHLQKMDGSRVYVFTMIDVCSRWAWARAYGRANTHSALDFLRRVKDQSFFFPAPAIRSWQRVLDLLYREKRY